MVFNSRQIGILYELIDSNTYRPYSVLCDKFMITEKTLRTDIHYLNDFLADDGIMILFKKGKGFYLNCDEDKKEELLYNFAYRYKDPKEAVYKYNKRDLTMLYLLSKGSIRSEDISMSLGVNKKKVSSVLRDLRNTFSLYGITLKSRPYEGVSMEGDEINIRNCLIDQVTFMSISDIGDLFYDNTEIFEINSEELECVHSLCRESIRNDGVMISSFQLSALDVAIILSVKRIMSHHNVSFNKAQSALIDSFVYKETTEKLSDKLESYYGIELPEDERRYFAMILMLSLNFNDSGYTNTFDLPIREEVRSIVGRMMSALFQNGIISKEEGHFLIDSFYPIVFEAYITRFFNCINDRSSTSFAKIGNYSPLSCTIGLILYEKLKAELHHEIGSYFLVQLILKIYYEIRTVYRPVHMNKIAIYTPFYPESCLSLIERIAYHCSHYIDDIKVFTSLDMVQDELKQYDLLLYFEDYSPENIPANLECLKISFFLDQEDREKLYSKLAPMNKLYKEIFADISWKSVINDQESIGTYDEALLWVRKRIGSDQKLNTQMDVIPFHKMLVMKEVFHIVLFTDRDELKTTKLFKLKENKQLEDVKIRRVMVHIISNKNGLPSLKTAEALIRRLGSLPLNNPSQISPESYNQTLFFDNKIKN